MHFILETKNEIYNFIFKALIPALVAVSLGLAVKAKTQRLTMKRVFISYITGVGVSYFAYPLIGYQYFGDFYGAVIGVIALTSEKIMEFLLFRFNVDLFLGSLIDAGRTFLINLINGKK